MFTKKNEKYRIILLAAVVALPVFPVLGSLNGQIQQILAKKDLANVKFGLLIVEAKSKKQIFALNENAPLTPASNMKLATSFAALKFLGREFEFTTTAAISGKTLVVTGGGDPLLMPQSGEDDFIKKIIAALKQMEVNEIENIIIDGTIFDDERVHPSWPADQLNRPYACEVSGLNYNGNCVKISAANKNGQVEITATPQTNFLKLTNNVQSIAKGDNAIGVYRTQTENSIIVSGKCRSAASFDTAIQRPAAFFGYVLAENLNRAGINTSGALTLTKADLQGMQLLAENKTSILQVLERCNKDSFQLSAESLFKMLAAKQLSGGSSGSWEGGRKVLSDYLIWLGAEPNSFVIDDGSGLSGKNKLSANVLVKILNDAYSSDLWPVFKETLSQGGIDGTLSKYFYQPKYKGKVHAKTGYINGVRAISGICQGQDGTEYIFSILANNANFSAKEAAYKIIQAVIDQR